LPALGISSAVLSLVSNNHGARKSDRVKETLALALKYGFVLSIAGIALGYSVGEWVVSIFDKNPLVVSRAMEYLYIEVFAFFGYVVLFMCVSTLQGIKRPNVIFYVGLYRQIFGKVILFGAIVFWLKLPYVFLWYGLFFIVVSSAIFIGFYTYRALSPRVV
jgi:Na+-driven multidrug efflux pump